MFQELRIRSQAPRKSGPAGSDAARPPRAAAQQSGPQSGRSYFEGLAKVPAAVRAPVPPAVTAVPMPTPRIAQMAQTIQRDGIVGLPGAFAPEFAEAVREDFEKAFAIAKSHPKGMVGRGKDRYYFDVQPEQIRGFQELITHPDLVALCIAMLGLDFKFVELGFDVPFPGAINQPWHRDFPAPWETRELRELSSLAFNLTTVNVKEGMGPFEIAPGTHWDDGSKFEHGMFPLADQAQRYKDLAVRKYPQLGDMSARTGQAVHRGTRNETDITRAVLILGVVKGGIESDAHRISVTKPYFDALPEEARRHVHPQFVETVGAREQTHDIEGLMMGGNTEDELQHLAL